MYATFCALLYGMSERTYTCVLLFCFGRVEVKSNRITTTYIANVQLIKHTHVQQQAVA